MYRITRKPPRICFEDFDISCQGSKFFINVLLENSRIGLCETKIQNTLYKRPTQVSNWITESLNVFSSLHRFNFTAQFICYIIQEHQTFEKYQLTKTVVVNPTHSKVRTTESRHF